MVDRIHTANLSYGSKVGVSFVYARDSKHLTDLVFHKSKTADRREA